LGLEIDFEDRLYK